MTIRMYITKIRTQATCRGRLREKKNLTSGTSLNPYPVIICPENVICLLCLLHIFKCIPDCFYFGSIDTINPDLGFRPFIHRQVVFVFNVPPTAKVIWRRGPQFKVSSDRLLKLGIEPATPGLQGKWFMHYTTAASTR